MKEYLICIDSDGCAIDSMDIKHRHAFGPSLLEVWDLEPWVVDRWNHINLHSLDRGINRFESLAKILREAADRGTRIEGLEALETWVREAAELSEGTLASHADPIFQQALAWSRAVNRKIAELPPARLRPFARVKETLARACRLADLAVVSSANRAAVTEEWQHWGLLPYMTQVMAQDAGRKEECIAKLLYRGYPAGGTLMVGDAPGDHRAARLNGVDFYPIIPGREAACWQRLLSEDLTRFLHGTYDPVPRIREFYQVLEGDSTWSI